MADPRDYMTPAEFAALTVTQQCDVWAAAHAGLVRYRETAHGQPRQYDREQVRALLAQARAT